MFSWIFVNRNLYTPNLPFNNEIIAKKRKCCSMEDRMVVANDCRKTTKLVWHGRENGCGLWPPALPCSTN